MSATARFLPSLRRIALACAAVAVAVLLAWWIWTPGSTHPLPAGLAHGAWLTHAWWGDARWFASSSRRAVDFQGDAAVAGLARRLHALGIRDWYVHACPATSDGDLPALDHEQARLLVRHNPEGQVLAWVGGVLDENCFPGDPAWRTRFAGGCAALVRATGIAGVQLNIEPCPPGTPGYLELLDDLRRALPPGARLSVAAYPPPTRLHPVEQVHWDEAFFRAVAARCDDLAVMSYDTAQRQRKVYTWLVATWTRECLAWSGGRPVRLGVPAYDDDEDWHRPEVEQAAAALAGISAGVDGTAPAPFAGVAVYAEWTLDDQEAADLGRWCPTR